MNPKEIERSRIASVTTKRIRSQISIWITASTTANLKHHWGKRVRATIKWLGVSIALILGLVVVGILWPVANAPLPDKARDRLITNARIVDVERGVAGPPTSVLIRDGVIAAVGSGVAPNGLAVLDARGGYLVPGFWDMHVHTFQTSPQLHLPLFVANGVTGVRDMMDCPGPSDSLIACVDDKRRWTRKAEAGTLATPRFVEVASFYFERPEIRPAEVTMFASTYKARGLDALKVYNRIPRAAYFQLAEAAERLNMRLVGHLPKAVSLDEAITAGQVSFEHAHLFPRHCFASAPAWRSGALNGLSPVLVAERVVREYDAAACARGFAAMRAAGTWFVPTHVTREEDARAGDPAFRNDPRLAWLDPLSRWAYRDDLAGTVASHPGERGRDALQRYFEHGLQLTGQAHRAGVPILVGTDTAIGGFRYHDEMALLVRAGLSPAQVLKAATIGAARYARADDRFGTIAVGKRADIVLLRANPLTDIRNTRRIRAVMIDGRLYDRDRLDAQLAFVRDQANSVSNWLKLLWGFAASSVSGEL